MLKTGIKVLTFGLFEGQGIPAGTLLEIYGESGAGKTALALIMASKAQQQGLTVGWVATEPAPTPPMLTWAAIDPKLILISPQDPGNPGLAAAQRLVEGGCDLVVVDSIAALQGVGPKGTLQAALNLGLPLLKRAVVQHGAVVLLTNQIRDPRVNHPAGAGPALTRLVDCRIRLSIGEGRYRGGEKIGQQVRFRIEKDHGPMATWGRTGFFNLFWEEGVRGAGQHR